MPKSGIEKQKCACGSEIRPRVAITIAGSSLHHAPRVKTQATTIYICDRCVERPRPGTRGKILEAIVGSAIAITEEIGA
jgi:hypothetical protein